MIQHQAPVAARRRLGTEPVEPGNLRAAQEPVLLRRHGSFPPMFGYLVYTDPYVDYVKVYVPSLELSWSGTRRELESAWCAVVLLGST